MATRHEFAFTFDIPFIKAALRRDILWRGYVIGGVLLILAGVLRFANGYWEPLMSGACGVGALAAVWCIHKLWATMAQRVFEMWTKQSPSGVIRYELDDDVFAVVTETSRAEFKWNALRRLWCYDDVWLLEIVKMQSVFFPPDQAPREARDYIAERCRASGVRV